MKAAMASAQSLSQADGRTDKKIIAQGWPLLYASLTIGINLYLFINHAYDDPFITFRYADNLRRGLGFVYNPGERVLSTTAPFYALLLAGLGHFWANLPRLSNLISALSLGLGGVFLYHIGQRWEESLAGIVAAVLFPFFPLMASTFGAETCFYVMLCLGAFALYASKHYGAAMALTALATLTRSDGVLVAAVLGAHFLITQRRIPWRPMLLFALLIAPWYLFSWGYFGSPLPVTLAAKQHQGQMAISDSFPQGFIRLLRNYAKHPLYWLHGALALLGMGYAFAKARKWIPMLAWGVLYFASYTFLGVSRYFWYYAPLIPVILTTVGLGVAAVKHWLPRWLRQRWRGRLLLVALLALLLWPQGRVLWYVHQHPDQRVNIYREVGIWLNQNTPSDASVGTLEVGIIGYYARRRMIGFAGLIQPDVADQMGKETTYQDTARWTTRQYHPDYLVLGANWYPELEQDIVFPHCISVQTFTREDYPSKLIVYQCDWTD
jgi:hypothetical protein